MTLEAKFTLARGEEHILGEGGNQCFLETRARFWSICVDALEWNEFLGRIVAGRAQISILIVNVAKNGPKLGRG